MDDSYLKFELPVASYRHMADDSETGGRYSSVALWHKLRGMVVKVGRKTLFSSLVLFNCLKDPDTPAWARGVIVGALGYLILPTDLIPDLLPGAGYGDDWSAILAALATVGAYIKEAHKARANEQLGKLFCDQNKSTPADFVE